MPAEESSHNDQELVSAFKNATNRDRIFAELMRKYQERLYWHIRRMVVTHEDTDDILQNVFVKVWKHLDGFRQDSNLYTWLYRIATNETLSWIEMQKRYRSVSMTGHEGYFEDKLLAQPNFDANKAEWKLQQAIGRLPEKQRLVFGLRYYDEMPYEEMSEVLGTSAGALKASYHHAAKKVEEFLTGG